MQLIADEARSFGDGLAGADAGHLQAILDHIKDVVITVAADGTDQDLQSHRRARVRLFALGGHRPVDRAAAAGTAAARLGRAGAANRWPRASRPNRGDLRPREFSARHKDGHLFPAELIASRVRIEQRDVYVICLRDTSERVRAEQALRDSEARYRTLVESAPELIVLIDRAVRPLRRRQ